MSNTYAFILGRNPALSVGEIISFFQRENQKIELIESSPEALLLQTKQELDANNILRELGGTIKIAKVVSTLDLDKSEEQFDTLFSPENLFSTFFTKRSGKVHFGISLYYLNSPNEIFIRYRKLLEKVNKLIKNKLKETGQSGGFVRVKERYLSSVSVVKNGLLTKGAEVILLASGNKLYVGKTLAVQEFEDYSTRDYGRPERDSRSGMLPPKLAKIMINLAGIKKEESFADPFCGSGTIITEGALLGYKNLYGSDIKKEAVLATEKNITWLKNQYLGKTQNLNLKLFTGDVSEISTKISHHSLDAIVTEPYLGPPFTHSPNDREVLLVKNQLSLLYQKAIQEFARILKKGGRVVIVFPAFKINRRYYLLDIIPSSNQMGFRLLHILPESFAKQYSNFLSERKTYLYGRGDEFVTREILVFSFI